MTSDDEDRWDDLDYWDWVDEEMERLFGVRPTGAAPDVIIDHIRAAEDAGETPQECARKLGELLELKYLSERMAAGRISKTLPQPVCIGCNLHPGQIELYVECAEEYGLPVQQYVREVEGTYNPENGHFLCTDCYVAAGMPSTREGWKAP